MSHPRNPGIKTPKDEMRTPPSLFKKLDDRFHFDIDAACTTDNCLCDFGFASDFNNTDALTIDWSHPPDFKEKPTLYCNPPYSARKILPFMEKGYKESLDGAIVVMLLPVDFSTGWWDYCMEATEWIRVKGRIHFNGVDGLPVPGSPMFDSVVVVFDMERRRRNGFALSEMTWK